MNLTRRNLIRTLTALPAAAFGIASMAPTLSSAASQRPQAAPLRYGAGLRLGALPYRDVSMPVAVHYPTLVPEQPVDLGPYRMSVAMRAPAAQGGPWPVVFVSHGTGGSVLGHADLAAGLARAGNVVVALEHPGDNYRDRSLVGDARYFSERPAQLLAVMRAVLDSEGAAGAAARSLMGDLSIDAKAIALLGHSAGGFTAAVVAGARADRARVAEHCAAQASADPMCALRDPSAHMSVRAQGPRFVLPADATLPATLSDPRVRALVLLAPLTVPIDPASAARLPAATLVVRALAAASFVPDLPPRAARLPTELVPERDLLRRLVGQLAALFALIVLGALVTEQAREGTRPAPPPSETPPGARGYLRVLAQPWAEVIVDGETIDTTPMARPITVAPGRHFVIFVHPNAPEEKRTVDVGAGQTVLLDVAMRVDRPQRDAGAEAGPVDDSP